MQLWYKAQKDVSDHDVDAFMSLKMIKDELSVYNGYKCYIMRYSPGDSEITTDSNIEHST